MDLARTATCTVLRSIINAGLRIRMYFIIISLGNYFKICGGSLFLRIKAIRWWDSAQPYNEAGEACPVPHALISTPRVLFQCHGKAFLSWRSVGSGNSALPGAGSSSLPSALANSGFFLYDVDKCSSSLDWLSLKPFSLYFWATNFDPKLTSFSSPAVFLYLGNALLKPRKGNLTLKRTTYCSWLQQYSRSFSR